MENRKLIIKMNIFMTGPVSEVKKIDFRNLMKFFENFKFSNLFSKKKIDENILETSLKNFLLSQMLVHK